MTTSYAFAVPGEPVAFTRMVRGDKSVRAAKYRAYKEYVGQCANVAGVERMTGDIALVVTIQVENRHKRKYDIDNVLKAVSDALNGIAYDDDKQIVDSHVRILSYPYGDYVAVEVGTIE